MAKRPKVPNFNIGRDHWKKPTIDSVRRYDQYPRVEFGHVPPSEEIILQIREMTDTILLSFSGGKDSLAAWIKCYPYFERIVPFFTYRVPDLSFEEATLRYYEEYFETHIIRLPNPDFYRMINDYAWQTPDRVKAIAAAGLPKYSWQDIELLVCRDQGVDENTAYTANGVRSADNIRRRVNFQKSGAINHNRQTFSAVWDYRKHELMHLIGVHGLELSEQYRLYGHSIGGLDYRFTGAIRRTHPEDFEKIKAWFPLIEAAEIGRYERLVPEYLAFKKKLEAGNGG